VTVAHRIGQGAGARPLRTLFANRAAVGSVLLLAAFVLIAVLAPALAPHDPADADLLRRLQPPAWLGGDWAFPLGCDGLGRDILSRLIWGSRVSILIGALVIGVATAGGILAGLAAGYFGGLLDAVISRLADILLAFPYLIFAIGLMAMMGPGLHNIVLALVYKEWVVPCRIVRGETLSARESEYVAAARALGASDLRVMCGEILPNVLSPVVVVATVRLAHVIILEASLSFLGLGVQPPTASWGAMVADGREYMLDQWWVSAFPGLAILTLVLAINVASQSLRDLLDTEPRS
jgi:ABC-type dipeptide/oligopeptide/nickel transport system permease subunit